jgi:hypothetical protein
LSRKICVTIWLLPEDAVAPIEVFTVLLCSLASASGTTL